MPQPPFVELKLLTDLVTSVREECTAAATRQDDLLSRVLFQQQAFQLQLSEMSDLTKSALEKQAFVSSSTMAETPMSNVEAEPILTESPENVDQVVAEGPSDIADELVIQKRVGIEGEAAPPPLQ